MHSDIVPGATFPDYPPELCEAWDAGDLSALRGWDKRGGSLPTPA